MPSAALQCEAMIRCSGNRQYFNGNVFQIKVNDFKDLDFSLINLKKLTKDRLLYDQWFAMFDVIVQNNGSERWTLT